MAEDERPMQSKPDERSLVVQHEQTTLQEMAGHPFLRLTGFSPQFPDHLMQLNNALRRAEPKINAIDINLVPGNTPLISTDVSYARGLGVHLRALPESQTAEFQVGSEFYRQNHVAVTIEDIQEFAALTFPNHQATVFAEASERLIEPMENFNMDLQQTTQDLLNQGLERSTVSGSESFPYYEFHLNLERIPNPLLSFILETRASPTGEQLVACMIYHFSYKGSVSEVERIMVAVAKLFDHYEGYPFLKPPIVK